MLINVDDDAADDGDVDDDDDEDDEDERKMMMLMCRRRKMMMLRRRMLRRKTDPKTGKHTLCEPAQSKCTWTLHKSHVVLKFIWKMPNAPDTISIEHRALTLTVRIPQCGHTVWGTITNSWFWSGFRNPLVTGSSVHCFIFPWLPSCWTPGVLQRLHPRLRTKQGNPMEFLAEQLFLSWFIHIYPDPQ